MTESANPTLTTLEDLFKDLVWDQLVKAALVRLFAAAPFLSWGPLGWAVGVFGTYFAGKLFEALREGVDLTAIVLSNQSHMHAYNAAALKLTLIAQTLGKESPEYQEANENAKADFLKFVSSTGV